MRNFSVGDVVKIFEYKTPGYAPSGKTGNYRLATIRAVNLFDVEFHDDRGKTVVRYVDPDQENKRFELPPIEGMIGAAFVSRSLGMLYFQ